MSNRGAPSASSSRDSQTAREQEENRRKILAEKMSRYKEIKAELFACGHLDERFDRLQQEQKHVNPKIIYDSFDLFYETYEVVLPDIIHPLYRGELRNARHGVDMVKIRTRGIGAKRVYDIATETQRAMVNNNRLASEMAVDNMILAVSDLKEKMQPLLELELEIVDELGGSF